MSEVTFKCPSCGWETVGVVRTGCPSQCICSRCQRSGKTIFMAEQARENYCHHGDGLFVKPKKGN